MNTLLTEQIQKHKITITALLSLLLFLKFPPIIRMLDYTAAAIDAGMIDHWDDKYVITVEGNTNASGSNEGDGVYRKRRPIKTLYVVAEVLGVRY